MSFLLHDNDMAVTISISVRTQTFENALQSVNVWRASLYWLSSREQTRTATDTWQEIIQKTGHFAFTWHPLAPPTWWCGFSFKLKRKHLNWTYIREDKTLSYQPDVFNFILFSKTDGSRASHFTLWDPLIGAGKLTIPMTLRIQTCV